MFPFLIILEVGVVSARGSRSAFGNDNALLESLDLRKLVDTRDRKKDDAVVDDTTSTFGVGEDDESKFNTGHL